VFAGPLGSHPGRDWVWQWPIGSRGEPSPGPGRPGECARTRRDHPRGHPRDWQAGHPRV